MLPLLKHLADGKEHSNRELTETLADYFQLTEDERSKLLPSGKQKLFTNRVAWAKADLKMAGLTESPKRGISVITQRGRDVLQQNPERIDRKFLKQFQDYFEKISQGSQKADSENNNETSNQTPHEVLEDAYQKII
jgi:restriction system protein